MKTAILHIRVTPELLAMARNAADAEGLSLTAWATRILTLAARKPAK